VGKGSGTTRGDRRRNARRERLRAVLPRDGAVIGIDLAEDKQAIAVVDHDVRVLARKTVRVKAFRLGAALDWAVGQARGKGFEHVAVACEPTGPRWLQVQRLCAERGLPLVCIQPLVSHIAREQQDYTAHKSDESDCVMIARLALELHCYVPEELDEAWAQLRHLGRRRAQLITAGTASVQRIRDFLSVAWPVVTETCAYPLESTTWLAAVQVVTGRCGGDPGQAGRDGAGGVHRAGPRCPARLGRAEGLGPDLPAGLRRADRHRGRGGLLPPGPAAPGRR
jgi:transposase